MFTIEMLPADHGDSLWIEYGSARRPHRVLIDGGTTTTYPRLKRAIETRMGKLPKSEQRFELLIITHIDEDHLGGILELLRDETVEVTFGDVWFNAYKHLPPDDELGGLQAEQISALIEQRNLPWNAAFGGGAVMAPEDDELPRRTLDGGLDLTILSPTIRQLRKLRPRWEKEVIKAGIAPGDTASALAKLGEKETPADMLGGEIPDPDDLVLAPFREDRSPANGASIVVLAEFEGKKCIFAADALPSVMQGSIQRLVEARGLEKLVLDAFKVAHHGSRNNTSAGLFRQLCCSRYLFSTNGAQFDHPHREAVARVLLRAGRQSHSNTKLYFNYLTPFNSIWDDQGLKSEYRYGTVVPRNGHEGVRISL